MGRLISFFPVSDSLDIFLSFMYIFVSRKAIFCFLNFFSVIFAGYVHLVLLQSL